MAQRTVRRGRRAEEAPTAGKYRDEEEAGTDEAEDDEERTTPRRGRRSSARADRGGRSREVEDSDEDSDEDDDDEKEEAGPVKRVEGGWGEYKKQRSKGSDFPDEFKGDKEPQVVKFLDDAPFATYRQHWVERTGKKSWICIEDECPLCDLLGDRPRVIAEFNLVNLSNDDAVEVWKAGTRIAGQLEGLATGKNGPLSKGYWAVHKTGKGAQTAYTIAPVKERDLDEDWGIDVLTKADIAELGEDKYDSSSVRFNNRKQLREIAEEALED